MHTQVSRLDVPLSIVTLIGFAFQLPNNLFVNELSGEHFNWKEKGLRARKMDQWAKELTAKPNDPSLIPRTHR